MLTSADIGPFFTGFVFCVNIIMGTGGLALPIAFCKAGWVLGTALMIFATFMLTKCRIPKGPSYVFFFSYFLYLVYEILGTYGAMSPICFGTLCL